MRPYVQSGKAAQQRLEKSSARGGVGAELIRYRESLRGFKLVINLLCVAAIILTPVVGVATRDPVMAALVATTFLLFIWVLEIFECRVKRNLIRAEQGRPPSR